jgi:hypothetical protein
MKPKYHTQIKNFGERQSLYGLRGTSFHNAWKNLFPRCLNKNNNNYKYYGGRGIVICERWYNFANFIKDMYKSYKYHIKYFGNGRKNCQLDRIDNNKGYYKENCRWTTSRINNNNRRNYKRMGNAKLITYNNKTLCIKDWSKEVNLNFLTFRDRLYRSKWSLEKALFTPVMKGFRGNQYKKINNRIE